MADDDAPQPSAHLQTLHQQAVDIGAALGRLGVGANWGEQTSSQQIRLFATGRALFAALVAKGILTPDEAECAIMEAVVQDMKRLLQAAEEQALKAAKGPQIALPGPPQLPPGMLDIQALRNGHRH